MRRQIEVQCICIIKLVTCTAAAVCDRLGIHNYILPGFVNEPEWELSLASSGVKELFWNFLRFHSYAKP